MLKRNTLALTVVLALLTAAGPLSTDMYLPSLPDLAVGFLATAGQTQLTLSAFLFGFAVGQFFYGPISDRVGRKPVLLVGLLLFTLASVGCASSQTVEALIGWRFVQAIGAAGPIVLARAIVRDMYDGTRAGRELSRMASIMGVVPAIAPLLGGLIAPVGGWRGTFLATGVFGAVLTAIVALRLPESLPRKSVHPVSFLSILRGFRAVLRHPGYRVYVMLAMLTYGGLFAFISGSSFVLQNFYGLAPLAFALSFGLAVLGYIAGTFVAQHSVGRLGLDGTIRLGVTCLALGGLLMLLLVATGVNSFMAVIGPMALYLAGVGLTMPQAMASALMPFPDRAGTASSLLGICQMSFAAILGIVLGRYLDGSALPLPIAIAATGVLALMLFLVTGKARTA